jgi:hypothetical protein
MLALLYPPVVYLQARARDAHAGEDREKKRPKYPPMVGGEPEDEAVVIEVRFGIYIPLL